MATVFDLVRNVLALIGLYVVCTHLRFWLSTRSGSR